MTDVIDEPEGSHSHRKGLWLTAAVLLFLILVGLIIALLLLLGDRVEVVSEVQNGIKPVLSLHGPGVGDTPFFDHPMGAAFGKNGRIYVADTGNDRVVVFGRDGSYLFQFGGLGVAKPAKGGKKSWEPGRFNYPTDVAVADDGLVYVADFGNDQIQVFDPEGKFLRAFPGRDKIVGKGASGRDGKGAAITSVTVRNDRVAATDKYQILIFDTKGSLLRQFGKPGNAATDLDHPNGVGFGLGGAVLISDSNHNRVVSMTEDGKTRWFVGTQRTIGVESQTSQVQAPRGLTVLEDGSCLVADALASQLLHVSIEGELIERLGVSGTAPGQFSFPTDVDAGESGRLVVAEKGLDRVQVVELER